VKNGGIILEEAYCSVCNKMVTVEIKSKIEPHFFQGFIIKCDTESAYCLYCHSQVYFTDLQDRNDKRIASEFRKKAR
jgi:hypothetical protein